MTNVEKKLRQEFDSIHEETKSFREGDVYQFIIASLKEDVQKVR